LPDRKGKVEAISRWLRDNGMNDDQANETTKKIKAAIFENLKAKDVEDTYLKILKCIEI
jgi:hypothetical protein